MKTYKYQRQRDNKKHCYPVKSFHDDPPFGGRLTGVVVYQSVTSSVMLPAFHVLFCSRPALPLLARGNPLLSACSAFALVTLVYAASAFNLIHQA